MGKTCAVAPLSTPSLANAISFVTERHLSSWWSLDDGAIVAERTAATVIVLSRELNK